MSNDKIAVVNQNALAAILGGESVSLDRPDFIKNDASGTEGITQEDIRLPRLGIAQGLSPQMIPGDSQYIEDLKLTELYNDMTKEIYGKGPICFIPLMRQVKCIEFRPRSEGGGIVDMNVPRTDPRVTQWRVEEGTGKRLPPVATLFVEFVIMILKANGEMDPVVFSIKMTNKHNRRAAQDLTGFIKSHGSKNPATPIYGVIYSLETRAEKNDKGSFGVPLFKQVGFLPNSENGKQLFQKMKAYADSLVGKEVSTNREPGDEDITFDAE